MLRQRGLLRLFRNHSRKALVIPIVEDGKCPVFDNLNENSRNRLHDQITALGGFPKAGQIRNLPAYTDGYDIISVVGKSKVCSDRKNTCPFFKYGPNFQMFFYDVVF